MRAMQLRDWKGWSQDPPIPRPHLRAGAEGKSVLLKILAYWRPSDDKQLFFPFVSASVAAAFGLVLICCGRRLCHPAIISVLTVTL